MTLQRDGKHPNRCKSPRHNRLKDATDKLSIRYCETCKSHQTFMHKQSDKHSKCMKCGNTTGKRSKLTVKLNKCFHPKRYIRR